MPATENQNFAIRQEVEQELESVTGYISNKYDAAVTYVANEFDEIGLSDHQQVGVLMIFFFSSLIIFGASIYLCYWSRRSSSRTSLCCRPEEKFTVYRRMVEFEPIIVVKPPASNDRGPVPI